MCRLGASDTQPSCTSLACWEPRVCSFNFVVAGQFLLRRFVFGGWDGHDTLDDLYEFSITTNQWCIAQPLKSSGESFRLSLARRYAVPGRGDVPPSPASVGRLRQGQMRVVPRSRYRHSAVVHGCCMFVFGGVDKRQVARGGLNSAPVLAPHLSAVAALTGTLRRFMRVQL